MKQLVYWKNPSEFSVDLSKYHFESAPYWKSFSTLKSDSIFLYQD